MSRIAVVGAGYVGLVTGVCFAQKYNFVTIIEKDKSKISSLMAGRVPFYEPGLDLLLKNAIEQNKIVFVDSIKKALLEKPQVIFSCVGTPSLPDGDADLSAVWDVATKVGQNMHDYVLFINKSTVPVGTAKKVKSIISQELKKRNLGVAFDVASNPEFLKEGNALNDFLMPDRVVVGVRSSKANDILKIIYKPFISKKDQFISMNIESAELTKYASNAMLATRISFMNQLAILADKVGADIFEVKNGMAKDSRIGSAFLNSGIGYGGSCFPKDVKALVKMGEKNNQPMSLVAQVDQVNDEQRNSFIDKIIDYYGRNLADKKIGIWGLAFKPETDDIRYAPAIDVIKKMLDYGAEIVAYDPQAQNNIKNIFGDKIKFNSAQNILNSSNFLIILTEWKEFLNYEPSDFSVLKDKVVFDGRNCFEPVDMKQNGIKYFNVGRNSIDNIIESKKDLILKEDFKEKELN
ncbi:MAG: UDP-glucose/GDP-mannose dehydrogenase family protein [bacterium]